MKERLDSYFVIFGKISCEQFLVSIAWVGVIFHNL